MNTAEINIIKQYRDRVPACGCFCGGCPVYTRDRKPCPGAGINIERCERCKTFHLCCAGKNISHCFQCGSFPCARFKKFRNSWLKYGQDLVENQELLREKGTAGFIEYWNSKI